MQLDAGKGALATGHGPDETDGARHVPRDIDNVANGNLVTRRREACRCDWVRHGHLVVVAGQDGIKGVGFGVIGNRG